MLILIVHEKSYFEVGNTKLPSKTEQHWNICSYPGCGASKMLTDIYLLSHSLIGYEAHLKKIIFAFSEDLIVFVNQARLISKNTKKN